MGRSYVWVCDAAREYVDPFPLMLMGQALFVMTDGGRWDGKEIRLMSDCGGTHDAYYLLTAKDERDAVAWGGCMDDVYKDVTAEAVQAVTDRFKDHYEPRSS